MRMSHAPLLALIGLFMSSYACAHTLVASSGKQRVHLVELFSSESCSSCPPADKWISSLSNNAALWKEFVPLVFHVDYWNYLGWKDDFSSDAMTKRQQEIAASWDKPAVYTPAVVFDGKEWRGWRQSRLPDEQMEKTKLTLTIYQEEKNEFEILVKGALPGTEYVLHAALLGMGLSTAVKGGENSGRILEHNFIVLDWNKKVTTDKTASLHFHLDPKSKPAKRLAIVAWIEKSGSPLPLQAVGGYSNE